MAVSATGTIFARLFSIAYFLFFLALPIYSKAEVCKPLPERLSHAVIPLDDRQGKFWDFIRLLLARILKSRLYAIVQEYVSVLEEKTKRIFKFL